jgi:hypothetical protein
MNLLILKAIIYDAKTNVFVSPSRREFVWHQNGIVTSTCQRHPMSPYGVCTPDVRADSCTCGIYGSSHPGAVQEYVDYPNSIIVLMNCYGWAEVWTGPSDLHNTFIVTTYSARVVGVLNEKELEHNRGVYSPEDLVSRENAIAVAAEYFQVDTYPWSLIQGMISATWKHWVQFDPFIQNDHIRMEDELYQEKKHADEVFKQAGISTS